jgi:hypothetical protein
VKNRGGGIGRIQVFVDDQEIRDLQAGARGGSIDANATEVVVPLDLNSPILRRGKPNEIRVIAWNRDGYLSSRGMRVTWTPPGAADTRPPGLFGIFVGVSRYSARDLELRFASKDAEAIARAFELAARRLWGPERVHLSVLSSSGQAETQPTKANLKKAFDAARAANPDDLLIVFFAGHGVEAAGSYAFATSEARTLNLSDSTTRALTSVTSDELTDWLKLIPARHKVLILDTCAAGAAANNLAEIRALSGDQIQAIQRVKERTGFHVLMGSAADAVSYEASRYGQGVLTYALLEGMRGAALRADGYVDVSRLFQHAADRVPELAGKIGGIQRPEIMARRGLSFDLGRLLEEDRKAIPVATPRPQILRPEFQNIDEYADTLGLEAALREELRQIAGNVTSRGGEPIAFYVDAQQLAGAIQIRGNYKITGTHVKGGLALIRDGEKLDVLAFEGTTRDRDRLVATIRDQLVSALQKL